MTKSAKERFEEKFSNITISYTPEISAMPIHMKSDIDKQVRKVLWQWHKEEVERILDEIKEGLPEEKHEQACLYPDDECICTNEKLEARNETIKQVKDLLNSLREGI